MRTIHKYPLPMNGGDRYILEIPAGHFKPLAVMLQQGVPMLWAEVEEPEDFNHQQFMQQRAVILTGTGHPCPPKFMTYVSTLQFHDGKLVMHYYVDARPSV